MIKWLDCEDGQHHAFMCIDPNYITSLCGQQHITELLFNMAVEEDQPDLLPRPCGDCLERAKQ